jgi:hypothetical protein
LPTADDTTEHEVNRANEFLPSAMGLTALVRLPRQLKVTVRAGRYERKAQAELGKPDKKTGEWQPHHWRKMVSGERLIDCQQFSVSKPKIGQPRQFIEIDGTNLKLELHVFSRPYVHAKDKIRDRILTFTLINRTQMSGDSPKDSECFFQCEFAVEDADGGSCFLEYPEREGLEDDQEDRSLRLLYRHRKTFAIGHGCAAQWPDTETVAVSQIKTDALPTYEIKPILPREIADLKLSMRLFSDKDDSAVLQTCGRLADEYKKWIEQQNSIVQATGFPAEYKSIALEHLDLCRKCLERIVDGIELLQTDTDTRLAFAWMNKAMLEQQLHYDLKRRTWVPNAGGITLEKSYEPPNIENPPKGKGLWRPFQLAFILMNLRSIAQRESSDRAIVDLIWFPTGGGKTEAYLGLTAFTIFRRRLLNVHDAGTTVLMRYTLRLLTTQQFQRAASLICACELIRRNNENLLGAARVSIGLWVGNSVTPGSHKDAVMALDTLLKSGKPNMFVVLTCPWCGAEMGGVKCGSSYKTPGYDGRIVRGQVVLRCADNNCEFNKSLGLPLLVVDDAIYDERPTLLIGTVDKFATLPWKPDARKLFGIDSAMSVSPPDLIIQDELHLISGALGSMVGMYEGTIDALCRHDPEGKCLPAKIVASTATICRARQQVESLYARKVFLFPPQGLRAGDSFFAEETTHDREGRPLPGRLYVGVFGSALSSHVTAQIRVMSALLQAVKCVSKDALQQSLSALRQLYPNRQFNESDVLDPYWTLMAYFNSLRELGHAATLIRADIKGYLNALYDRLHITGQDRRFPNHDLELTSRIQSSEITKILQQLFNPYPATDDRYPVDVCLATNMIQVGLDVPRLGLMTVVGQPKTTSEYIQATSRVGRDAKGPGLVVTVFNPGKPRDRSHFEHFRSYHQSIYRWVEPTSVTPFAIPVRERALHAQLVTLARYWGDSRLRKDPNPPPNDVLLNRIRNTLIPRIQMVDLGESKAAEKMLEEIIERWQRIQPQIYGQPGSLSPQEIPLMYPSGTEPRTIWSGRSKATPSSMRNVDSSCEAEVISQFQQP